MTNFRTEPATFRRAKPGASIYFSNSDSLLFTSDQNNVGTNLVRESVFRIFDLSIGIKAGRARLKFSGFGGELSPDFPCRGSELNDQCGRRIRIYLLGHSISSEQSFRLKDSLNGRLATRLLAILESYCVRTISPQGFAFPEPEPVENKFEKLWIIL